MLALPQRRQHLAPHDPTSVQPSPLSPPHHLHHLHHLSQQHWFDQKLLHDYLASQQHAFHPATVVDSTQANPFMTGAYDYDSPTIRIQQSTPTPQLSTSFPSSPMNATASGLANGASYHNVHASQSFQTPMLSRLGKTHQRASSSSSVGSTGSQYQAAGQTAGYPAFSNLHNLPTPTHTPTQEQFLSSTNFNNYPAHPAGMDSSMAAQMSMKQALMDQHRDEELPSFGHSAQHSVSSHGRDSPATPHTTHGDDMDFRMTPNDLRQHTVPKFERTYTDVAADYSYDPHMSVQTQSIAQSKTAANALLSPCRNNNPNDIMQRSLQAAQMARSHSPSSSASRCESPFRRSSPYRQPGITFASREQNSEADAALAMKPQISSSEEAETISPKDALLDFRETDEESKVALFPDRGTSEYDQQYHSGHQYTNSIQSTLNTTSQSHRRDSWATRQFSSSFPASVAGVSQPSSNCAFAAPSLSDKLHALPFTTPASQYRATTNISSTSEQNPEFPTHLTSMESSASEAGFEPGSQTSEQPLPKPTKSRADSGTYTCTYHECTQRFETPQKLQKHKRDGHRNTATTSTASMTSAALLERNSQAGPHKCARTNPTTGKPCNTIFSRPYDLTRHEDTIHNARKQKVRCALCVEEKTFSRNDALTRHMRVVHPEIDFPGKHRRRGGSHD